MNTRENSFVENLCRCSGLQFCSLDFLPKRIDDCVLGSEYGRLAMEVVWNVGYTFQAENVQTLSSKVFLQNRISNNFCSLFNLI